MFLDVSRIKDFIEAVGWFFVQMFAIAHSGLNLSLNVTVSGACTTSIDF